MLAPGLELLMPPGTNVERRPDIWIANRLNYDNANRNTFGLRPVGRLREKATLEQAQQEVEAVAAKIRAEHPISRGSGFYARLEPMHKTLVDDVRPAILALMGAVMFLLLIACAVALMAAAVPDVEIEANIRARLAKSKISSNGFQVRVRNGTAILTGKAAVITGLPVSRCGNSFSTMAFSFFAVLSPARTSFCNRSCFF